MRNFFMSSKYSTYTLENKQLKLMEPEKIKSKVSQKYVWRNVIILLLTNFLTPYGVYLAITAAKWQTIIFAVVLNILSKIGTNSGAHRLWSHRSYKANTIIRFLLVFFQTIAFEVPVYMWARDHRVHHKYQDTDADPYNASRGFWYSHIGWLLVTKYPDVKEKGMKLDTTDLEKDYFVMFQYNNFWSVVTLLSVIMPTFVPWYFWSESLLCSFFVAFVARHTISMHCTSSINSFAHLYGNKPYDSSIFARENRGVTIATLGEGWHNYHHTFPWDYKASEIHGHNLSTLFIDLMAKIGWAHDLKTPSPHLIKERALRTGDGTYKEVWGWGDIDIPEEHKAEAIITNKTKEFPPPQKKQ